MPTRITLAALLAAGLLAAGCGGDDDDETTTDTTTAEAGATGASGASGETGQAAGGGLLDDEFATQANAICEEGNKELDAAGAELFGGGNKEPSDAEQEQFVTDVVVPSIEGQIAAIRALGEPDEGAEELSAVLEDADSAVEELKDDPSLLSGQDDPFSGIDEQMDELGLPACAD